MVPTGAVEHLWQRHIPTGKRCLRSIGI